MSHKALLFTFLLLLPLLLYSRNADTQAHYRDTFEDFPSEKYNQNYHKASKKSISDQLLLATPEPSQFPSKTSSRSQEKPDQKGWFGKLKTMAKDSLNNAKEKLYQAPEFVAEQAGNIGDKAKRLSDGAMNQATKIGHKVEQIYDQVTSKNIKTESNQNIDSTEKDTTATVVQDFQSSPLQSEHQEPQKEEGIFSRIKGKISDFSSNLKEKVKDVPIINKFHSEKEKSQDSISSSDESFSSKASDKLNQVTEGITQTWKNIDVKGAFSSLKDNIQSIPDKISEKYTELTQPTNETQSSNWMKNSFNKVSQKIKDAIPEGTSKIGGNLKEKISSTFQGIKDKASSFAPDLSHLGGNLKEKMSSTFQGIKEKASYFAPNIFHNAKEAFSALGSTAKTKFTGVLNHITPTIMFPINAVMTFGSWIWNLMAWRKLIYWFIGIVITCLVLKVGLFLLPFIQMTVSILKTPFQVMFMLNGLIKQFYPKVQQQDGAQRQKSESSIENSVKYLKEKDRSYQRYSSSQEEWHRESTIHEPKVIKISDSEKGAEESVRRFEEKQEIGERYYNYYKCYGCNQQWENVTVGKGPIQECKNRNCRYSFGPYHEIPLLNQKQKKEIFDKVKTE